MRCFVISLSESIERREQVRSQFGAAGLSFRFFNAVDLTVDRNRYFHHCDDETFLLRTGRTPVAGELGCFASHRMLWRTCRFLNEPLIIFEDDVCLAGDTMTALSIVRRQVRELGFIRLQHSVKLRGQLLAERDGFQVRRCARYPHGTTAYAISPEVAHAFIEQSEVFCAPVDVFIKRFWEHGQPLHALSPAIACADPFTASTIQRRQRVPLSKSFAVRRWLQKCVDAVDRARFNLGSRRRRRPVVPGRRRRQRVSPKAVMDREAQAER